jgi:hypothetical protein
MCRLHNNDISSYLAHTQSLAALADREHQRFCREEGRLQSALAYSQICGGFGQDGPALAGTGQPQ